MRKTGCAGQRDKLKYVPTSEYGYGALMSDYMFLEDVGRKVKEWGRDIGKGKYQATGCDGTGGGKRKKSNTEALQVQLEIREIPLVWILHRIFHYFQNQKLQTSTGVTRGNL